MAQAVILTFGLGFTAFSIWSNQQENRKRATVDLILHQRSDLKLNEAMDLLGSLVQGQDFPSLSQYLNVEKYPKERSAILTVLNHREFVSVGINTGIIDEMLYKRSYYNMMLRDWKYLAKTIEDIRNSAKGSPTNFQDFELLVKRWQLNPLQKMKH